MSLEGIRRTLVVAAGTMGQQIGLQCAMHGHAVTVHGVAAQCPQAARARIRIYAERLVNDKSLAYGATDAALSRIGFTTDTPTLAPCPWTETTSRSAPFAAFHFHTYGWDSRKMLHAALPSEPGMPTRVRGSILARKRIANAI